MRSRAEWSRPRLVGHTFVAVLGALAALPAYLAVPHAWRPLAVRLTCAVVVALGCARAMRWARAALPAPAPSPLDVGPPAPPGPELDARFLALRDDVVAATRSRRYFDVILWPRLGALADGPVERPAARGRLGRRGPSLAQLDRLVRDIEERP